MAEKTPINIPAFGGINKSHTRNIGQPSAGLNFWTRNGRLFTRGGTPYVVQSGTFSGDIKSLNSAVKMDSGVDSTVLLLEEGANLWHKVGSADWASLKSDVAGNGYSSCRWQQYIILASKGYQAGGSQMLAYDVSAGTVADLTGDPPNMEYVINWKQRIWGWGPNYSNPQYLWFCGEESVDGIYVISKDLWPATYFKNVGEDPGHPVLACFPYGSHLLILSSNSFWRVYGDDEPNFVLSYGGATSLLNPESASLVGDYAMWLGEEDGERKVFAYSGTSPVIISQPIEEILQEISAETFAGAMTCGFAGQFWILFPETDETTALVYDTGQKEWYHHEFPFEITCVKAMGNYLEKEYLHFGLTDGRVVKVDDSVDEDLYDTGALTGTPITTEFTLGPINHEGRRMKAKSFYINAEPRNDFSLEVYSTVDDKDENGPTTMDFETSNVVTKRIKLSDAKGQNISIRVTSTDKVNELQTATIVIVPKGLK
jgi:hypothetical protein